MEALELFKITPEPIHSKNLILSLFPLLSIAVVKGVRCQIVLD
jgi:nitrate reductase NapE component